jgi:hypothetical protein
VTGAGTAENVHGERLELLWESLGTSRSVRAHTPCNPQLEEVPVTTRSAVALFTLAACSAWSAVAETAPSSLLGERVRITTEGRGTFGSHLEGRVLRVGSEGIVVQSSSPGSFPQSVALRDLWRLDVHTGRRRAIKEGLLTGAVLLGLTGAAVGATHADYLCECDSGNALSLALSLGAVSALIGGGIGAGVGTLVKKDEWKRVEPSRIADGLSLQPVRRGVAVAYTIRF